MADRGLARAFSPDALVLTILNLGDRKLHTCCRSSAFRSQSALGLHPLHAIPHEGRPRGGCRRGLAASFVPWGARSRPPEGNQANAAPVPRREQLSERAGKRAAFTRFSPELRARPC